MAARTAQALGAGLLLAALPLTRAAAQTYQSVTPIDAAVGNGYVVTTATATDAAGNTVTVGKFEGTIAFGSHVVSSVGRYDIFVAKQDPAGAWLWATRAGSYGDDRANGVSLDASGNVLAAGWFRSYSPAGTHTGADFGATTLTSPGNNGDAWVGKLNGTTGAWLWATRGGGTGDEEANAIAVDGAGNPFVVGTLSDNGARFGTTTLNTAGISDVFVGKLNGATGAWQWAKRAGGTSYEEGYGIAVDGAGNALITGTFSSGNSLFGATTLHNSANSDGDPDIYVAKLNGATGAWLWAAAGNGSSMSGSSYDFGYGIAADGAGNPLITGFVSGTTATFGAITLSPGGIGKVLAAKLNGATGAWVWATINSGSGYDIGRAIAVDAAGNGLITGALGSQDAQFGSTMLTSFSQGLFVAKIGGSSGNWVWAVGASNASASCNGAGIGADGSGNPLMAGNYSVNPAQDLAFGSLSLPGSPEGNIVVGKLDGATGAWTRVTNATTSSGARTVAATAVDAAGNVYVTGTFSNTITFGATTLTSAGANDIYVAKQAPNGSWLWAARAGSGTIYAETGKGLAVDASGNVLVTGEFGGAVLNLGPHTLVNTDGLNGSTDVWTAKLNGATGAWLWAVATGNPGEDIANGVAADGAGNALLAMTLKQGTDKELAVAKLSPTGASLWLVSGSGSGSAGASGVAVDAAGDAYVTGQLSGTMTYGAFTLSAPGSSAVVVAKLDGATGAWQWATRGGGADYNGSKAITIDPAGNPLITGYTTGGPFGGLTLPTLHGHVLIAKLDGTTGTWTWVNYGGGNASGQDGQAIAVDAAGNGFIAGELRGGIPSPFGATTLHPVDGATGTRQDALIAKFNGLTGAWLWAKSAGGGERDGANAIAVDASNHLYVGGYFLSTAAGFDSFTLYGGQTASTGFLAKLLDQPTINTLSPAAAPVGTLVTATGTLLGGASLITFAGGATAVPTNVTATSFQFVIPNTANTGPVTVTATAGTGPSTSPLTVVRDLVVTAPATTVLPGPYRTITVNSGGEAILGGDVSVSTGATVKTGGSLDDGCHRISGAGTFTVQTGATLSVCDAAGIALTGATGMVRVTGLRTFAAGSSYVYDGAATQATGLGLPATVQNLTVSNPMGVDLSQNVGVKRLLDLPGAGDLRLGDKRLTLLADAAGTAMLTNGGAGRVIGTATVQTYIAPNGVRGATYRHFGSPVNGATVGGLACAGFAPSVNPAYNTAPNPLLVAPAPNVFGFDETRYPASADFIKGYYSPADLMAPLTVGRGYSLNIAGTSKPTFTGTLTQDDVTMTGLTQTGGFFGAQEKSGWHLLSNPFASPLDWDLMTTPAGMSTTVSVWQPSALGGQYLTRANGTGYLTNGLIPMGQAFFVQVTGATLVDFTIPSAARLTTYGSAAHYRAALDARPSVRLSLSAVGAPAPEATSTTVYFQAGATPAVDARFDGQQPAHNIGVPTLVSLAGVTELAVNGLPLAALAPAAEATTVELLAELPAAGTYTLTVGSLTNLAGTAVVLLDRLTNTRYDLAAASSTSPVLTFSATTAKQTVRGRFALVFGTNRITGSARGASGEAGAAPALTVWPNPARSAAYVTGAPTGTALTLLDGTGRVVRTLTATAEEVKLSLEHLTPGVYVLRAGTRTQRLVVE